MFPTYGFYHLLNLMPFDILINWLSNELPCLGFDGVLGRGY